MLSESAVVLHSDSSLVPELLFPLSALVPLTILKEGLLLFGTGEEPDSLAEADGESSRFELCGAS